MKSIFARRAIPEAELAARSWPGGVQPTTALPRFERVGEGRIELASDTPGASIEFRVDAGPRRLYSQPLPVESGRELEARAVRCGWAQSDARRMPRESPTP